MDDPVTERRVPVYKPRICKEPGCGRELPPKAQYHSRYCRQHTTVKPPVSPVHRQKRRVIVNRYRRLRYARLRHAGVCVMWGCGRMSGGHVYCPTHRAQVSARWCAQDKRRRLRQGNTKERKDASESGS